MTPHLAPFLREVLGLLRSPDAWHPSACANAEGFRLGEHQQARPGRVPGTFDGPTWHVPVQWNLPCAITYLLGAWEHRGLFVDVSVESQALRDALWHQLGPAALHTTDYAVARAALVAALAACYADRSAA